MSDQEKKALAKKLPSNVTIEDYLGFKEKYDKLKVIVVTPKDEEKTVLKALFRPIPNKTVGAALRFADTNVFTMCSILVKDCWLAGDEAIKTKSTYITQAGGILAEGLDDCEVQALDL